MKKHSIRQDDYIPLIRSHLGALYRIAWYLTLESGRATDLISASIRNSLRPLRSISSTQSLKVWLFKDLVSQFTGPKQSVLFSDPPDVDDIPEEFYLYKMIDNSVDPTGDPAGKMLGLIEENIAQSIESLPAQARLLILLGYVENFTYEEIACITGQTVISVRRNMRLARIKLQRTVWERISDSELKFDNSSILV
jgi:DNA-directed RNA polymerase specialized sigma24 family protein